MNPGMSAIHLHLIPLYAVFKPSKSLKGLSCLPYSLPSVLSLTLNLLPFLLAVHHR